jgi:Peptide N-acetyl-beta-D-glucosaminyl asparaginase amidase A
MWKPAVLAAAVATVTAFVVAPAAQAGEGVYYQDPITADMPVQTPPTTSCTVSLASDYVTNTPSGAAQDYRGTFDPPVGCPGPWAKVVLHFTGHEAGRQYDRSGGITMGDAQIFFTSTPEPDPDGITWHAQKDVTEYSSLFTAGQPYTISVPNYLNSVDTGVMHIAADLTFYRADAAHPAPAVPTKVIGLGSQNVSTGSTVAQFPVSDLPTNITRADLEVYPKGNACDEFWYGALPDDFVAAHPGTGLCGGGPYRELDASLDGTPAGASIPFPNIFTGGVNPLLWRPMPAVDAFNLLPRDFDLTPFVGSLVDGAPHNVGVSVANAQSYWGLTPNLLLWTDPHSAQTTGGTTQNTLAANPTRYTDKQETGSQSTNYTLDAQRSYTIAGWVDTSTGRVTTAVTRSLDFSNTNDFTLTNFRQQTGNDQELKTVTTTTDASGTHVGTVDEHDPLTAVEMFQQPSSADFFTLPAHVTQSKLLSVSRIDNGTTTFSSTLSNSTQGAGILSEYNSGEYRLANGTDQQEYVYSDSTGVCYDHSIKAAQGYVTNERLSTSCS